MNFNVYIKKDIGKKITRLAASLHRSRNSIISDALEEWLTRHDSSTWPKGFFDFEPLKTIPNFKKYRKELKEISEDPLA